jgi:hypothetical protein
MYYGFLTSFLDFKFYENFDSFVINGEVILITISFLTQWGGSKGQGLVNCTNGYISTELFFVDHEEKFYP